MPLTAAVIDLAEPAELAITLVQGDAKSLDIQVLSATGAPLDLSGSTGVVARVRDSYAAVSPRFAFTASVVDAANGIVRIGYSAANVATLPVPASAGDLQRLVPAGVWDLDLTDGTSTVTILAGPVVLSRQANAP